MSNARNLARLLPDSSGKIALPSQVSGVLPDANAPSGSVLQTVVVTSQSVSAFSTSSSTLQNVTDLSITITPQSASSKFLITGYMSVGKFGWSHGACRFGIARNDTTVYGEYVSMEHYGADEGNAAYDGMIDVNMTYLDSPNTTSAITYRPQLAAWNTSYAIYLNRYYGSSQQRGISYLIVQEIAA